MAVIGVMMLLGFVILIFLVSLAITRIIRRILAFLRSPRIPRFFGLHAEPTSRMSVILPLIPFILSVGLYITASEIRHMQNPKDKLLPTIGRMAESMVQLAYAPDDDTQSNEGFPNLWRRLWSERNTIPLPLFAFDIAISHWKEIKTVAWHIVTSDLAGDMGASLRRIAIGTGLGAITGYLLGINLAVFPGMRITLYAYVSFLSIVPPLAVLPIIFFAFGVDELGKVMLIFIGTFPGICGMIFLAAQKISNEQITKALTLGASSLQVVYRVIFPRMMPNLINAIRVSLGGAWLFLIAAENVSATEGLGFRIYLVRRYFAMDVIIPYVIIITLLGLLFDRILKKMVVRGFRWFEHSTE